MPPLKIRRKYLYSLAAGWFLVGASSVLLVANEIHWLLALSILFLALGVAISSLMILLGVDDGHYTIIYEDEP